MSLGITFRCLQCLQFLFSWKSSEYLKFLPDIFFSKWAVKYMLIISSNVITPAFQYFKCLLLLLSIHMKLFNFKAYHVRLLWFFRAAGQISWWSLKLCHINCLVITAYQGAMLISQDFFSRNTNLFYIYIITLGPYLILFLRATYIIFLFI